MLFRSLVDVQTEVQHLSDVSVRERQIDELDAYFRGQSGKPIEGSGRERSIAVFTVLKLAGACYLVFLGVQAIRHRHSLAESLGSKVEQKTAARIVLDGFMVGVTNPKVIVFFSAILPQFVDRQAGHVPVQIIVLGAIFAGVALLSDSAWALAAGAVRAWLSRSPRRLALLGGTGGLAMIAIGTRLAFTGRHD